MSRSTLLSGINVGVSRPFDDLFELSAHYVQAQAAISLAGSAEGATCFYDDVAARHLADCARLTREAAVFTDWRLERLVAYDAEHGTSHVADLDAYLNCGRSVRRAAECLHVHRNSMRYRMERVEAISGARLSDEQTCFLLQLALAARP